jgi:hypothetical protein
MASEKLKPSDVTRLPPGGHNDGRGLLLQVSPSGARSWIYRYELHYRNRETAQIVRCVGRFL